MVCKVRGIQILSQKRTKFGVQLIVQSYHCMIQQQHDTYIHAAITKQSPSNPVLRTCYSFIQTPAGIPHPQQSFMQRAAHAVTGSTITHSYSELSGSFSEPAITVKQWQQLTVQHLSPKISSFVIHYNISYHHLSSPHYL